MSLKDVWVDLVTRSSFIFEIYDFNSSFVSNKQYSLLTLKLYIFLGLLLYQFWWLAHMFLSLSNFVWRDETFAFALLQLDLRLLHLFTESSSSGLLLQELADAHMLSLLFFAACHNM